MPPLFNNDPICPDLQASAPWIARGAPQGFLVFACIGAQKRRQIRINEPIPGDPENDARRRNIFPYGRRVGRDLLYRVAMANSCGPSHSREGLLIRRNRISRFSERGLGLTGRQKNDRHECKDKKCSGYFSHRYKTALLPAPVTRHTKGIIRISL